MIRKLLICPYFGPLPEWFPRFAEQWPRMGEQGYDIWIDRNLDDFKRRCRRVLDIDCPITEGSSKIWDYRGSLGLLYANELRGYDWYGHCDLDMVFGRLDHFVTDEMLDYCNILTDCQYDYLAGPFTLYRNITHVNTIFQTHPDWRATLENPEPTAWVETFFSVLAKEATTVTFINRHAFSEPQFLERETDGSLWHRNRELTFFHFNRDKPKRWPNDKV